jgi:hypothetical protein
MRTLRALGGCFLLGLVWTACSGTTEQAPVTVTGDAGPDALCQVSCAAPPPGCHYDGSPTCDPPACPPLVCSDGSPEGDCFVSCPSLPAGCVYLGEPTCPPPKCPPVQCDDAAADAGSFPQSLEGIWLFGWSGGMNHFSWVRISVPDMGGGAAQFLSGEGMFANVPIWNCSGAGTWMLTQKVDTIGFYFPSSCAEGFKAYTFLSFQAPSSFPNGAILEATVEDLTNPGMTTTAYKFLSSQCDAAMTTCTDPLQ